MTVHHTDMQPRDLPYARALYNHYVRTSTATFHMHELDAEEMKRLLFFDDRRYRSYIVSTDETACGYAAIRPYGTREGYRLTAEITLYFQPEMTGRGVGKESVAFLESVARENGFHTLIASVCSENETSVKLFERCGFVRCAHFREVGHKFGRFLDVIDLEKIIV